MEVGALQGANGIPNLMGALLATTMQQSIELATRQVAVNLSLQAGGASVEGLGDAIDVYA